MRAAAGSLACLVAAFLAGCEREPILSLITLDTFVSEVPADRKSSLGLVARLERVNGEYALLGDDHRIWLDVQDPCIERLVGEDVFVRLAPADSYDAEQHRLTSFISLRLRQKQGVDAERVVCMGEMDDPAW